MSDLFLVRHGQASFGEANYDKLSELGHEQAIALGKALAQQGVQPKHWVIGSMLRHRETMEGIQKGMGIATAQPYIHVGLNEYDFTGLLEARFAEANAPDGMHTDRKTHFKLLKETVRLWQNNQIKNPPETWEHFCTRLNEARDFIKSLHGGTVVAVSSGGAIAQMARTALLAPSETQILMQLQVKNCSVHKFIFNERAFYLSGFNETPHITSESEALLTYS